MRDFQRRLLLLGEVGVDFLPKLFSTLRTRIFIVLLMNGRISPVLVKILLHLIFSLSHRHIIAVFTGEFTAFDEKHCIASH